MNEPKENTERGILGSLALSMLLASVGVSIPNVALPTLAREFGATFSEVQSIILSYLLAITVMIVSAGRLGDLFGRKRILLGGIFLFVFGALFCGLAPNLWILICARVIQGLGAATIMALSIAFISDTVPKGKIGSAMGIMGTMSAIGTASGPSIGGFVIAGFGWRGIFFLMVMMGFLSLYFSFRYLPKIRQEIEASLNDFDAIGTIFLGITLATYSLGVSLNNGHFGFRNWALITVAAAAGLIFILRERTARSPLIRLTIFRDVRLSANLVMNILVSTVMMSTLVVGPFYLSRGLGLDSILVGAVMSIGPLTSVITGVPAGRIVDRLGSATVTSGGLIFMAVGASALCLLPQLFGMLGYIVSVVILSPGYQLFQAANNTAVMANVTSDGRGVFSGLLSLSRNIGLITGASVLGALFAFYSDSPQISTASSASIAAGMRITFSAATALIFIALAITFFSNHISNGKEKNETQFT